MFRSFIHSIRGWVQQVGCYLLDEELDYRAFRQHRIEINRVRGWLGMRPLPVPPAPFQHSVGCYCLH